MKKSSYFLSILILAALFTQAQTTTANTKINISKLIAYEKDNRFHIEWSTDGTSKSNYWEVQSSADGKRFSTIAFVMGPDPSKPGEEYEYKGKINNQQPQAYYRIIHIDTAGIKQQSDVIKLIKLGSVTFINPNIKSKIPELL